MYITTMLNPLIFFILHVFVHKLELHYTYTKIPKNITTYHAFPVTFIISYVLKLKIILQHSHDLSPIEYCYKGES